MNASKPTLVGINHVALEVGDVDEALRFYKSIFEFRLRGSHVDDQGRTAMAFIDIGDQFLALPWGNHIEIVAYRDVQFSKTEAVLRSMDLALDKSDAARQELRHKGML